MPSRTRTQSGRFGTNSNDSAESTDIIPSVPLSKTTIYRILALLMMLLFLSPWIFLMIRNNSLNNMSQKVADFYDDNFSCQSRAMSENILKDNLDKKTNIL